MKPSTHAAILAAALAAAPCGCRPAGETATAPATPARPVVAVVNHPLECFARRIAGDLAEVVLPAPAGVDPAYWQPGPAALRVYQEADLILLNGASYAGWVEKAPLPAARTVDTSAAFRDRLIEGAHGLTHSHGPEGEHEHRALDFNTWLDPALARLHARAAHEALARLLPGRGEALRANAAALDRDLAALEQGFEAVFREGKPPVIASHPVYNYFGRRYQLDLASMHWEPDAMPDEREWAKLTELLEARPGAVMLWEDEPAAGIRARLQQLGLRHCVFRTAANRPAEGDFLAAMRANLARLEAILR